ncbi:MAG: hypothetical protein RKO24_13720 [Candidatus Competibacter sp.]|nr:hypothetical protein [Candidatus Competibacter sp.]
MIELDLSADLRPTLRRLDNFQLSIPFVIASSLTKTAVRVKPEIRKEMTRVFDRPTPYTLNSIFVTPALKKDENPTARVWLKDSESAALDTRQFTGGTPAAEYVWPQIVGGGRSLKRFEWRLRNSGYLPPGMFVVPGPGAKLDRYGNADNGQLVAVLSKLGTVREALAAQSNRRKRNVKYANAQYFVSRGDRGLRRGVWQRVPGRKVICIYRFVDSVTYRSRFDFPRVAREEALRILPEEFDAAIDRALGSNS